MNLRKQFEKQTDICKNCNPFYCVDISDKMCCDSFRRVYIEWLEKIIIKKDKINE